MRSSVRSYSRSGGALELLSRPAFFEAAVDRSPCADFTVATPSASGADSAAPGNGKIRTTRASVNSVVRAQAFEERSHHNPSDEGRSFDPFSGLPDASHLKPLEERPIGGLGVVLVDGFVLRRDYRRLEPRNCVRVWFAARSP